MILVISICSTTYIHSSDKDNSQCFSKLALYPDIITHIFNFVPARDTGCNIMHTHIGILPEKIDRIGYQLSEHLKKHSFSSNKEDNESFINNIIHTFLYTLIYKSKMNRQTNQDIRYFVKKYIIDAYIKPNIFFIRHIHTINKDYNMTTQGDIHHLRLYLQSMIDEYNSIEYNPDNNAHADIIDQKYKKALTYIYKHHEYIHTKCFKIEDKMRYTNFINNMNINIYYIAVFAYIIVRNMINIEDMPNSYMYDKIWLASLCILFTRAAYTCVCQDNCMITHITHIT
jgi:hypothetical protein